MKRQFWVVEERERGILPWLREEEEEKQYIFQSFRRKK